MCVCVCVFVLKLFIDTDNNGYSGAIKINVTVGELMTHVAQVSVLEIFGTAR